MRYGAKLQIYVAQCTNRARGTILITPKVTKTKVMRSLLYVIAVILIIGWLLGAFAWHAGGLIHILLVLAVISLLLGLIRRGEV